MFKRLFKNKKSPEFGEILDSRLSVIAYNVYTFNSNSNGGLIQDV